MHSQPHWDSRNMFRRIRPSRSQKTVFSQLFPPLSTVDQPFSLPILMLVIANRIVNDLCDFADKKAFFQSIIQLPWFVEYILHIFVPGASI